MVPFGERPDFFWIITLPYLSEYPEPWLQQPRGILSLSSPNISALKKTESQTRHAQGYITLIKYIIGIAIVRLPKVSLWATKCVTKRP